MRKSQMPALNHVWQIENYLTSGTPSPRQSMTDRQRLARRCNVSVSHVTNMLHEVRTPSAKFLNEARKIATANLEKGLA